MFLTPTLMVPALLPFPGETQRGSQVQSASLAGPRTPPPQRRGGTAPWEGVLCRLWVRACRVFWKRRAWGRRESCREGGGGGGATAPDPGPSFGHLQKGWGPLASPHLICPHWVPGKVGLGSWGLRPLLWMQLFHPLGLSLFISKVKTVVTPPPPTPGWLRGLTKAGVKPTYSECGSHLHFPGEGQKPGWRPGFRAQRAHY